jgi:hypothetical protein
MQPLGMLPAPVMSAGRKMSLTALRTDLAVAMIYRQPYQRCAARTRRGTVNHGRGPTLRE